MSSARVLHECDVLRATRSATAADADAESIAADVRAIYRANGLRAPECARGYDWRDNATPHARVALLVDAALPFDADARKELEQLARDIDVVFRPLRHEEHDPEYTRNDKNSERRQRVADALMLMHFPRETADASIVSMSARDIEPRAPFTADDIEVKTRARDDGVETENPIRTSQDAVATVVVACTHPGYVRAGCMPPHLFMRMLRAPVLYVHARPPIDAARAPTVAEHLTGTVEDACRVS